jgi:hypothetical protein
VFGAVCCAIAAGANECYRTSLGHALAVQWAWVPLGTANVAAATFFGLCGGYIVAIL